MIETELAELDSWRKNHASATHIPWPMSVMLTSKIERISKGSRNSMELAKSEAPC